MSTLPVPQTADEMLSLLAHFIANVDCYEAQKVWDVLSALRGPDGEPSIEEQILKEATTCIIRHKVFGKHSLLHVGAQVGSGDQESNKETRAKLQGNHFVSHAIKAFKALGLDW